MARIRTIKPQFWLDEKLGTVCREARLLYIGLWNLSDDYGVFEYRPARIKAQLFPYDDDITGDSIKTWLEDLEQIGDIKRFSCDGKDFGHIPTFLDHQEIKNPSKWTFAEPPVELTETTPSLPQPSPSINPVLPVGKRNREKDKGIGSREKKISKNYLTEDINQDTNLDEIAEIARLYEENIGRITRVVAEQLTDATKTYPLDSIREAIKEATLREKRNWKYIEGILRNKARGQSTPGTDKYTKGKYGHVVVQTREDIERVLGERIDRTTGEGRQDKKQGGTK